jgi:hypothetical protein
VVVVGMAAQPAIRPSTTHTAVEKRSLEKRIVTPPRLSDYRTKKRFTVIKKRMTIRAAINYLFYQYKNITSHKTCASAINSVC